MPELVVKTPTRAHECAILVGSFPGAELPAEAEARLGADDFVAVVDARVAELHHPRRFFGRRRGWRHLEIEAGEAGKTASRFLDLCERLLALGIDRRTVIVAVGGGVTGDLAGFAAATLLRGLRLVQVPTTLLAQVDSSVGGKTGINLGGGKNMLGAFHQPELVLADPAFLATLPEREYLAGLAEVVKYGVLGDRAFFERLVLSAAPLARRDPAVIAEAVIHCCRMKAEIVAADEKEAGRRKLLNLGHTFGHAIEALAGYDGSLLHGEAVAVGIAMASAFAGERGIVSPGAAREIRDGLAQLRLPRRIGDLRDADPGRRERLDRLLGRLDPDRLAAALVKDKKASRAGLALVLPRAVGACEIIAGVPPQTAAAFIIKHEKGTTT
ncbi:MAG: 3-dehydroquinate synthase [Planctomycetota bacterium]|jgi:3-dehydroquinate synthase|nr:3-dehydroquinate synthase [Planctomycetota bacterium]